VAAERFAPWSSASGAPSIERTEGDLQLRADLFDGEPLVGGWRGRAGLLGRDNVASPGGRACDTLRPWNRAVICRAPPAGPGHGHRLPASASRSSSST